MIKKFSRALPSIYFTYKFSPEIAENMRKVIDSELENIAENNASHTKTVQDIMSVLGGVSESDETNLIIAYNILYNVGQSNVSIEEIAEYLENKKLEANFENLGAYIEENCDGSTKSLLKEAYFWRRLFGTTVLDIDWENPFANITIGSEIGSWINVVTNIATGGFSVNKSSYGNMIGYIKNHNYFYPEIISTGEDDGDILSEDLTKFMLTPIYTASGDLNTFKNERYAVESYYENLATVRNDRNKVTSPTLSNSIFTKMWSIITGDNERIIELSNDRTYNTGSLLYLPSIRSEVYDNSLYNNLLKNILNMPFNTTDFDPYLGYSACMDQLTQYVKRLVENTDKTNTEISKAINDMTSKITNYTKIIAEAKLQAQLEKLGIRKEATYNIDIDGNGTEKSYSALEAINKCEEAISKYGSVIDYMKSLINNWYDTDTSNGALYKTTFDEMFDEAFAYSDAEPLHIKSIEDWNKKQFFYALAPFFKYDKTTTETDADKVRSEKYNAAKEFMGSIYTDMKKFSTSARSLISALSSLYK